jgi:hypothetical protein
MIPNGLLRTNLHPQPATRDPVRHSLVGQDPCDPAKPVDLDSCFSDLPKTTGLWLLCVVYALVRHVDNAKFN